MRLPRGFDIALSLTIAAIMVWPELGKQRTWWWATMRLSREGARRCGQVAIMAENRYRAEVDA